MFGSFDEDKSPKLVKISIATKESRKQDVKNEASLRHQSSGNSEPNDAEIESCDCLFLDNANYL